MLGRPLRWIVPVGLAAIFPFAIQGWSQRTFVLDLGGQVAIFAIVLLGLTMLYGWTGQISLGHAAFIGLGAYTTAIVDRTVGVGFEGGGTLLAIEELLAVMVVCAMAGVIVGMPAVRISGIQLVIITFGAGQIFLWFLATYSSFTGGDQGLTVAVISAGGQSTISVTTLYFVAMATAFLLTAFVAQIRRAPAGRAMRALRHSSLAAQSVGVHIPRTKLLAFVLSSVMAGVGGWLYAHQLSSVAPGYFVMFTSIFLLAAILMGGIGTLAGAWLGAAYLILVPEAVRSMGGGGNLYTIVSGVLLIVVVIFAPHGLASLLSRAWRTLATKQTMHDGGSRTEAATVSHLGLASVDSGSSTGTLTRDGHSRNSLEVRDVSVTLGGVTVLDDVSLAFDASHINGVLGPNGAGKTTLLNVLTGFVQPLHGSVTVNGQPIDSLHARQRAAMGVARTFQTPRLMESESVEDNMLLGRYRLRGATFMGQAFGSPAHRRCQREDRRVVRALADDLGLSLKDEGGRLANLSAGTRRLVELGRVLAMEPSIILLDEPIAGLDAEERTTVAELIVRYQRSTDALFVIIEHNVEWVRAVCEHLVVLDSGSVLAIGSPQSVLDLPDVREAYFGLSANTVAAVEL